MASNQLIDNLSQVIGRGEALELLASIAAAANTGYVPTGLITGSGLTQSTGTILGRVTASTGAVEELTPAANDIVLAAGVIKSRRSVTICVFGPLVDVATGDGKAYYIVPSSLNGKNLVRVHALVITAGVTNSTTIQVHNLTQTADMLTALLEVETGETGSDTSAPGPTIDTANDDVATNDLLRIDVDAVSTTAPKGLYVTLEFE